MKRHSKALIEDGGQLNPTGKTVIVIRTDEASRYFEAELGFKTLKEWDARDKDPKRLAKEIDSYLTKEI